MINLFIILVTLICIVRSASFSVWYIKNKNIAGALSVIFLILCTAAGLIISL